MKRTASGSNWNGLFNLERLRRTARLGKPNNTPMGRVRDKRRAVQGPFQMHKLL